MQQSQCEIQPNTELLGFLKSWLLEEKFADIPRLDKADKESMYKSLHKYCEENNKDFFKLCEVLAAAKLCVEEIKKANDSNFHTHFHGAFIFYRIDTEEEKGKDTAEYYFNHIKTEEAFKNNIAGYILRYYEVFFNAGNVEIYKENYKFKNVLQVFANPIIQNSFSHKSFIAMRKNVVAIRDCSIDLSKFLQQKIVVCYVDSAEDIVKEKMIRVIDLVAYDFVWQSQNEAHTTGNYLYRYSPWSFTEIFLMELEEKIPLEKFLSILNEEQIESPDLIKWLPEYLLTVYIPSALQSQHNETTFENDLPEYKNILCNEIAKYQEKHQEKQKEKEVTTFENDLPESKKILCKEIAKYQEKHQEKQKEKEVTKYLNKLEPSTYAKLFTLSSMYLFSSNRSFSRMSNS